MFDPFYSIFLFAGPAILALLVWLEIRRKTSSLKPRAETYFLGFMAASGLSQGLLLFEVQRFGEGMNETQFSQLAGLSLAVCGIFVIAIYFVVALIRRKREAE